MIRPGVCFCPVCGYTSREPFYAEDLTDRAAWLRKDPEQGYYLVDLDNSRKIIHLRDPLEPDREQGMPDSVWCYFDGAKGGITELRRCCPNCYEGASDNRENPGDVKVVKTHFKRYVGRVPMYVVALIGATNAGKTAFLGALGSGALRPLNEQAYPYKLKLSEPNDVIQVSKTTAKYGDTGNSNFIEIWERNRQEEFPAAMVFLVDIGGENFQEKEMNSLHDAPPRKNTPLDRLINGDRLDHPGIDGAILVDPAVSNDETVSIVGMIRDFYQVLNRGPVAYVFSCADKLIAQEAERAGREREIPMLTRDTFPNRTYTNEHVSRLARYYLPERIRERLVIQEEIAMSICRPGYREMVDFHAQHQHHGFVVRSCNPYYEGDKKKNDYTHQFNVADPIIWLLNRLNLFPLKLQGGGKL